MTRMTDEAFAAWSKKLGLADEAQALIAAIRASPPARRVQGAAGNVSGVYPSRKMGWSTQFESHRVELPGVIAMEYAPDVLEYYDQPPAFLLRYRHADGRNCAHWHTPDFFVLAADGARWEEWKAEDELERLAMRSPYRYRRETGGDWRCPPGEAYAAHYGLAYRVRSSADIDWIWTRNILFLDDYLRANGPLSSPAVVGAVRRFVAGAPGVALDEVLQQATAVNATTDDVYGLIASGRLWVDLHGAPLVTPAEVRVFGDEPLGRAYAAAGESVAAPRKAAHPTNVHDGNLVRDERGELADEDSATGPRAAIRALLDGASPTALAAALRRHAYLTEKTPDGPQPSERALRSWHAQLRAAEDTLGCGFVGLLDRRAQRGNRTRRLPERTRQLLDEAVACYETPKQLSKAAAYGELVRACTAAATDPPSSKTFTRALAQRPKRALTEARQGRRAAYEHAPWHWELTLTTPRHGDRPWEIGHIDHTQLDVETVCSQTGRNLGRPWATFLTDAYARRLPGLVLSYDPPSYRSCLLVLRACVRRWGRLPQTLVVDGGKEFGSVYFETLLARYAITKKTRPATAPRFGSVCERLFGTANTEFIHRLAGNTQITKNVRQVTKANDPRALACWTFGSLLAALEEWADTIYDTLPHPALGQSPRAAWDEVLARTGQRPQRLIANDENFRMLTLPTTAKGEARVQPGDGVKINYLYYWSELFRRPEVEGTRVPVRYDPFDAGTAYAFVRGQWVACRSQHYLIFQGHTERELQLATVELRRRQQTHVGQFAITAHRLADFLTSLEGREALLLQRLRDLASHERGTLKAAPLPEGAEPGSQSLGTDDVPGVTDDLGDEDYGEYR